MPLVKPINGHTKSMAKAQAYFEGKDGERALAQDFINIGPVNGPQELTWAEQMRLTRELAGNDTAYNGHAAITYKHYVLSADPADRCTLAQMRELACAWARENFGDYEVAITYHDDNANHVMHAHVIVNNTNLATGKRLSSELTDERVRGVNNSAQSIALLLGLSGFARDHRSMTDEEMSSAGTNVSRQGDARGRAHWRDHGPGTGRGTAPRPAAPRRGDGRTLAERGLRERGGDSWKEDVRERVELSKRVARGEKEFLSVARAMGLEVSDSARGDWVFARQGAPASRRVTGKRLGYEYKRDRMRDEWLTMRLMPATTRALPSQGRAVLVALTAPTFAEGRRAIPAQDLADMLDYVGRRHITSYSGFGRGAKAERMLRIARALSLYAGEGSPRKAAPAGARASTGPGTRVRGDDARLVEILRREYEALPDPLSYGGGGGSTAPHSAPSEPASSPSRGLER